MALPLHIVLASEYMMPVNTNRVPYLLAVVCLLLSMQTSAGAIKCPKLIGRILYQSVRIPTVVAYHSAKVLYYPVVGPIDIGIRSGYHYYHHGSKDLRSIPVQRLSKDFPHISLYALLLLAGHGTHMMVSEFDDKTKKHVLEAPEGPVVVVDSYDESDLFARYNWVAARAKQYPGAYIVDARSDKELLIKLKALSEQHGPIGLLEHDEHGMPGYSPTLGGSLERWADEVLEKGTISIDGKEIDPRGIFAKGARVKFVSCYLGSGLKGLRYCDGYHSALLIPNGGGETMAPRLTLVSSPSEMAYSGLGLSLPPSWLMKLEASLELPTLAVTSFWNRDSKNAEYPLTDPPFITGNRVAHYQSSTRFVPLRKKLSGNPKMSRDIRFKVLEAREELEKTAKEEMASFIEVVKDFDPLPYIFFKKGKMVIGFRNKEIGGLVSKLRNRFPEYPLTVERITVSTYINVDLPKALSEKLANKADVHMRDLVEPEVKSTFSRLELMFQEERQSLQREKEKGVINSDEFHALSEELENLRKATGARMLDDIRGSILSLGDWKRSELKDK